MVAVGLGAAQVQEIRLVHADTVLAWPELPTSAVSGLAPLAAGDRKRWPGIVNILVGHHAFVNEMLRPVW